MNEIKIKPVGSGFIIYYGENIYPASTAFICNKIVSKITRQIESESGMRQHEFSAGKLNFKGVTAMQSEAENTQPVEPIVKKNSLKKG